MSDVTIPVSVSRMTLASVGKGLPDEQFQAEIKRFLGLVEEHRESLDHGNGGVYSTAGNHLKAKITLTVELDWNLEADAMNVAAGLSASMPSRKTTSHAAIVRGDKVFVEREDEQPALVSAKRRDQQS